jgi:predicted ATPase
MASGAARGWVRCGRLDRVSGRRPGAPVGRLTIDRGRARPGDWPYTLPAVAHVLQHGLRLDPGVSVLVGPNGSGKSTLVEALAAVWARRVSVFRSDFAQQALGQPSAEDSDLHDALRLEYTPGGPSGGLFLRAERFHAQAPTLLPPSRRGRWAQRLEGHPVLIRSHGEGFLEVLAGMTAETGLYVLDEPESALSFDSSLTLLALMHRMRAAGSQIVLATHSPILASLPGARVLELDEHGITPIDYDSSDLVTSWRSFLTSPERYLRHLAGED